MIGMDRNTGKALTGEAHLAQSIGDILTTPTGTRLMRRDYGSMLADLLDQPLTSATRLLVFAATALALRRWEPRLSLKKVGLEIPQDQPGQAALTIEAESLELPQANERLLLSIPIRAGGATPVQAAT